MCALRRSKHAVYDLKYHIVWIPKYRKKLVTGEIAEYTKELFEGIAEEYGLIIDTMEVVEAGLCPKVRRAGFWNTTSTLPGFGNSRLKMTFLMYKQVKTDVKSHNIGHR